MLDTAAAPLREEEAVVEVLAEVAFRVPAVDDGAGGSILTL